MPDGLFQKLPDGPACERCGSRSYVASIRPHLHKTSHLNYTFECPRCYHLTEMSVALRGGIADQLTRVNDAVANAELRLERQASLIRRLAHQGRDTARAIALLEVLGDSLAALQQHQQYVQRVFMRNGNEA